MSLKLEKVFNEFQPAPNKVGVIRPLTLNPIKYIIAFRQAVASLDAYIGAAGIEDGETPLFQLLDKAHKLTDGAISRRDMLRMVKTRCSSAGLSETFCNHTFRGTGMTVFLSNGGSLEATQDMASHADPRTTEL